MTEKHLLAAPFVQSATARLREALVVPPSAAFDRLSPVQGEPSPILDRAQEQHRVLVRTLRDLGVLIHHPAGDGASFDETGYATFVADYALVLEAGAILLRPSRIERRREAVFVEARLADFGIPILGRIEAPGLVDGSDIVVVGRTAYVGVPSSGTRSNTIGRAQLADILGGAGLKMVELTTAPGVLRLNAVLSALDEDCVAAAPDYVDLAHLSPDVQPIGIPRGEQLGASLLCIGRRRAVVNLRFREALPILRKAKIGVHAIDLWEFGKVGAGPASLALALKRG